MEIKARYFTKICYTVDEYVEFVTNLSHNDITSLISVFEKDDKIILTFKEVYTVL